MTDASQIERVARAICTASGHDPDRTHVVFFAVVSVWELFIPHARAAIAAMQPAQIIQPDTLGMGDYAGLVTREGK